MSEAARIKALRSALKAIAYRRPAGPIRKQDPALAKIIEDIEEMAIVAIRADTTAGVMAIRAASNHGN